eukprot:jgi/Mesvir1/26729/Mv20505-RA.1
MQAYDPWLNASKLPSYEFASDRTSSGTKPSSSLLGKVAGGIKAGAGSVADSVRELIDRLLGTDIDNLGEARTDVTRTFVGERAKELEEQLANLQTEYDKAQDKLKVSVKPDAKDVVASDQYKALQAIEQDSFKKREEAEQRLKEWQSNQDKAGNIMRQAQEARREFIDNMRDPDKRWNESVMEESLAKLERLINEDNADLLKSLNIEDWKTHAQKEVDDFRTLLSGSKMDAEMLTQTLAAQDKERKAKMAAEYANEDLQARLAKAEEEHNTSFHELIKELEYREEEKRRLEREYEEREREREEKELRLEREREEELQRIEREREEELQRIEREREEELQRIEREREEELQRLEREREEERRRTEEAAANAQARLAQAERDAEIQKALMQAEADEKGKELKLAGLSNVELTMRKQELRDYLSHIEHVTRVVDAAINELTSQNHSYAEAIERATETENDVKELRGQLGTDPDEKYPIGMAYVDSQLKLLNEYKQLATKLNAKHLETEELSRENVALNKDIETRIKELELRNKESEELTTTVAELTRQIELKDALNNELQDITRRHMREYADAVRDLVPAADLIELKTGLENANTKLAKSLKETENLKKAKQAAEEASQRANAETTSAKQRESELEKLNKSHEKQITALKQKRAELENRVYQLEEALEKKGVSVQTEKALQKELNKTSDALVETRLKLDDLVRKQNTTSEELRMEKLDKKNALERQSALERELNIVKQAKEKNVKDIQNAGQKLDKAHAKAKLLQQAKASLEGQIKQLTVAQKSQMNKAINDARQDLDKQKQASDETIALLNLDLRKLTTERDTAWKRIDEIERALSKSNQEVVELTNAKETASTVETSLSRQILELEKDKEKSDRLISEAAVKALQKEEQRAQEIEEAEGRIAALHEDITAHAAIINDLNTSIAQEAQRKEKNKNVIARILKRLRTSNDARNSLEEAKQKLEERIKALETSGIENTAEHQAMKDSLENELEGLRQKEREYQTDMETLKREKKEMEAERDNATQRVESLTGELEQRQKKIDAMTNEKEALEVAKQKAEEKTNQHVQKIEELQAEIDRLNKSRENNTKGAKYLSEKLEQLKAQHSELEGEKAAADARIGELKAVEQKFVLSESQVQELNAQLETEKAERLRIEEEARQYKASMANLETQISDLTKEKDQAASSIKSLTMELERVNEEFAATTQQKEGEIQKLTHANERVAAELQVEEDKRQVTEDAYAKSTAQYDTRIGELKAELSVQEDQKAKTAADLAATWTKLNELQAQYDNLAAEKASAEARIKTFEGIEQQFGLSKAEVIALNGQLEAEKEAKNDLEETSRSLRALMASLRGEIATLTTARDAGTKNAERIAAELQQTKKERDTFKDLTVTKDAAIAELKEELASAIKEKNAIGAKLKELRSGDYTNEDIADLQRQYNNASFDIATLRRKIDTDQASCWMRSEAFSTKTNQPD